MRVQDELFSVVDEDGRFLQSERREVCHCSPDLIHTSTSVMVFDKSGRIFLQKRAMSKDVEPGKWDQSCSGHCAAGEAFEAAARREVMEELGFAVGELRPFWLRLSGSARETELCQTFTARWDGPFRLNPAEISEGRFWTRQEFLAGLGQGLFTPHLEEEGRRYFLGAAWPRALAVDLDGTALDSRRSLAPETVAALVAARRRGVRVYVATARPPRSARAFVEALGVEEPVIYYNGAMIVDPKTGRALRHDPMAPELVGALVKALRALGPAVAISFEVEDRWLTDDASAGFTTQTALLFGPNEVGPLESFLVRPITKVLVSWPRGDVAPLASLVQEKFGEALWSRSTDKGMLLQIMRLGVDKEHALAWLLAQAGIEPRDLLAVGDDMNDAGMLRLAGRAVAMGNAPLELKRMAQDVTASNDSLGLARTVEKYILSVLPNA